MEDEKHDLDVQLEKLLNSERMSEQLKGYRLLQMIVRRYTPASDEGGFSDPISPTIVNEEWAREALKRLLQLLRESTNLALATAGLNLLTVLIRTRPTLLPVIVPALIDLWEKQPEIGDPRSLAHALRMQLTNVTAMPNAEKYFPLVMDALSSSSSSTAANKKKIKTSISEVEEAEEVNLRALLDITRIPVELVAQVIIGSVQFLEEDVLLDKISRWRPTVTASSTPAVNAMLDPRRKRTAAPQKSTQVQLSLADLEHLALDSLFRLLEQGVYLERLAVLAVKIASFLKPNGFERILEEFGKRIEELGTMGKSFLSTFTTVVWVYQSEQYQTVMHGCLSLLLGIKPEWIPHFINNVPVVEQETVLQMYNSLFPSQQYATAIDVIVAVICSRQGRNLPQYLSLLQLPDTENAEEQAVKRRNAVIEGICKLYPKYGKQEFEALLQDDTKDLFYAMLRVNLDLARTFSLEKLLQLSGEEREMLGRSLARSPLLLDFLKRLLISEDEGDLQLALELIKSFVPRTAELQAALFEMITGERQLDACFALILFNKELSREHFALLWPKFISALVNNPLAVVLAPPSGSAEEREKMVYRWCGKFVELGLCSVVDVFIQVHLVLGDIKTCNFVVKSLLGQAAWRSSTCLMPALMNLAERTPLPVLFYRTILTIHSTVSSINSGGVNLLNVLIKSFKGKPWEHAHLWEGVVRCVKALLPGSAVVILQLPLAQVQKIIEAVPGVKVPLKEYLNQQPPSYRSRFKELFPLLK